MPPKAKQKPPEQSVGLVVSGILDKISIGVAQIVLGIYACFNAETKAYLANYQYIINNLSSIENGE